MVAENLAVVVVAETAVETAVVEVVVVGIVVADLVAIGTFTKKYT